MEVQATFMQFLCVCVKNSVTTTDDQTLALQHPVFHVLYLSYRVVWPVDNKHRITLHFTFTRTWKLFSTS